MVVFDQSEVSLHTEYPCLSYSELNVRDFRVTLLQWFGVQGWRRGGNYKYISYM